MYTSLHRITLLTALSFALLTSILSAPAVARLIDDPRTQAQTSSLAGTTDDPRDSAAAQHPDSRTPAAAPSHAYAKPSPKQDLRGPDAFDATRQNEIALALERYYSTYGEPDPVPVAEAPAPVDDPAPWLPIAVGIAAALTIAAASVTLMRRRRVAV
jgi:hypothetical protein